MLLGIALEQIGACSCDDRCLHQFLAVVQSHDRDLALRQSRADLPGCLDPSQHWHNQIQDCDVRPVLNGEADGVVATDRLAQTSQFGSPCQDTAQPSAHDRVIVGQENSNHQCPGS